MEKINFKKENIPFTQVANVVLNNPNLTTRAKGLYAYLYSKPGTWNFSYVRIANDHKESKNTILKVLKELEEFGYLSREKLPDGRVVYHLSYDPEPKVCGLAEPETKVARDQSSQRPKLGTISNKDIKVIKSNSNKYNSDIPKVIKLFESVDPKNKTYYGNTTQRKACEFLLDSYGMEKIENAVKFYLIARNNDVEYLPTITKPTELMEKWSKLLNVVKRQNVNSDVFA